MRESLLRACVLVVLLGSSVSADPLTFEKDVRSIFKAHCFQCHGEDGKLEGNLDVRLVRSMRTGGDSGPALDADHPTESLILERIRSGEMPPVEKKVSAEELETLSAWVLAGARTARPEPEKPTVVTDEERAFWSFQPIRRPAAPAVSDTSEIRTPIDAFLLARLEKAGLGFAPEADRVTLIRRLSFDLLGLPPSPADIDRFVADDRPDAYERLVDRTLESPAYGERWGRHWLDVAGYADSDGYSEKDFERKYAYKYRDYVIRAFNDDMPLDRFIQEQLAGDELLSDPASKAPADLDRLSATGFLRMAPDGTADGSIDQPLARNDVVAETLKIVSSSLLGLTVGCAQCHNHRYDPIPQADYYRLRAVFEPALDVSQWRNPNGRLVSLLTAEERKRMADIDAQIREVTKERTDRINARIAEVREIEIAKLPEGEQAAVRSAVAVPEKMRTADQKALLKKYPSTNVSAGSLYLYDKKGTDALNKEYQDRIDALKADRPVEDFIHALTEPVAKKPPITHVFYRGDHTQPRDAVQPAGLSVLSEDCSLPEDDPALPTTGRRLAYARRLTDGNHPLVARVLANRVWLLHFGRGIVGTPADFGVLGSRPTHPELLDWLASELMDGGWKLKRLHRLILTSTAYRQSSARRSEQDAVDPDNDLVGRMNVRRLEAEIVRDAILSASGRLNPKMFGPPVPVMPDEVGQIVVGVDTRDSAGRPTGKFVDLAGELHRRSVYIQVRRTMPLGMLETFDAPTMSPNCDLRNSSTVAPQSLLMMNNAFVVAEAEVFADRLLRECEDAESRVRLAWRLAVQREPTSGLLAESVRFLEEQESNFAARPPAPPAKDPKQPAPPAPSAEKLALASFCQALLSSNAFLYVD